MEYHSGGSLPLLGRPRYCPGANANGGYLCETGHCCGETGCCTYYYELWWFWLLWTVLILFSCCCAYRHRRAKLRVQQQQRQREISLLAYHGASSYPSSMLDLSFLASLKLPSYEEVAAQPSTPPPPYSSVFTTPRYPQPPRTVDPHLLTQHGPLLHRPLSDGPSSLSSDNSSSCSCDSCCPSSPCSSSLSAPVTYETDTSHASTPSEATPLTLDVTMENIMAGATFLEVNERMVATVAIDIGEADAAGALEPGATDSLVPNQTVTVAVVTRAASPQPLPSPGSEAALPVGNTSPIKQQLDITPHTPIASTCSSSTLPSPSVVDAAIPSIQIIIIDDPTEGTKTTPGPSTPPESTSDRPTANPTLETLNFTRTFDPANVPKSPASVPSSDVGRTLALDPNHSLVSVSAPSNPTQAQDPVPTNLSPSPEVVPSNLPLSPEVVPSNLSPSPEVVPSNLPLSPEVVPSNLSPSPEVVLSNLPPSPEVVTSNLSPSPDVVPSNLSPSPEVVPSNLPPSPEVVPSNLPPSPEVVTSNLTPSTDPLLPNLPQAPEPVPSNFTPVPDPQPKTTHVLTPAHSNLALATDAALTSPTLAHCQNPELSPGSGQTLVPHSLMSDLPQKPGAVAVLESCLDSDAALADSGPCLVLSHLSESNIIVPLLSNIQAGLHSGPGSGSVTPSSSAPGLSFPKPASSSSSSCCPAITIESESNLAPVLSPRSALSPSSPPSLPSLPFLPSNPALPSPTLPAPALLLDPLTALHQSDKGGSSSGHASSLSPSPRATQSPPKQTLFSPCVDVFEPGPPNWEDGEEEQEEEDNDDDEDDDMGADESQYRHRRLTGDSGIEVCRCRVEEEDDEDEEEEEEGEREEDGRRGGAGGERDKKGVGNTDLHDSVDCPARGQITTGEGLTLCNPNSTTTPTSEDSGEVVIVMETV